MKNTAVKRVLLDITKDASLENVSDMRKALQNVLNICGVDTEKQSHISLCFTELANNSVQHNRAASRIGLQLYTDAQGWWVIVKDNGEKLDQALFTMAARGEEFTEPFDTQQENGRGIALVVHLSETLNLISEQALLDTDVESTTAWTNGICLGWIYPDKYKCPNVLIVDDDPVIRALYRHYLASSFNVREAENGTEALTRIKQYPIDIVLSDINMPTMNGIELRNAMIADSDMELIPFIFLTTFDIPQVIEQASTMGIDDFLCKPISKASLIQAVNRILTRSSYLKNRLGKRIDQQISCALAPVLPTELLSYQLSVESRNTGSGGGDMVLYHQWEDRALIIVVDVMGHNDTSKFFSYAYAGYIKGLLSGLGSALSPERLLEDISQALYHDTLLSQLMLTCCVIELSSNRQVKMACAGHPAPLLVSTDQEIASLPVSGTLAGLLPSTRYSSFTYNAQPGERIAIYTDGLIDSMQSTEDKEGLENVVFDAIKASIALPLQESTASVFNIFDQAIKNTPIDDALLLLIEC